jgi:hypothetical protein
MSFAMAVVVAYVPIARQCILFAVMKFGTNREIEKKSVGR